METYNTAESDLLRDSLARGEVWVRVVGNSMSPCFSDGDSLLVGKAERFRLSDILLCSHGEHLLAHRLIRRKRDAEGNLLYQTKPDNGFSLDPPVPLEAILGKVVAIRKGQRIERTDTIRGRLCSLASGAVSAMKIRQQKGPFEMRVAIGGLSIHVSANRSKPLASLRQAYARFPSDSEPDVTITLHYGGTNPYAGQRRLFASPYSIYADPDLENCFYVWAGRKHIGIADVLRSVTSFVLMQGGGFLLHSCGAVLNGYAYCLAGASGAGKSTVARLLDHQGALLSDETIAIRKRENDYYAWATPFFGDFGESTSNLSAPIKALIFIKKAGQFRAIRLDSHDAARRLMQNVFLMGNGSDRDIRELLDTVADMSRKVPTFELEFLPNRSLWQYIREKMFPGG